MEPQILPKERACARAPKTPNLHLLPSLTSSDLLSISNLNLFHTSLTQILAFKNGLLKAHVYSNVFAKRFYPCSKSRWIDFASRGRLVKRPSPLFFGEIHFHIKNWGVVFPPLWRWFLILLMDCSTVRFLKKLMPRGWKRRKKKIRMGGEGRFLSLLGFAMFWWSWPVFSESWIVCRLKGVWVNYPKRTNLSLKVNNLKSLTRPTSTIEKSGETTCRHLTIQTKQSMTQGKISMKSELGTNNRLCMNFNSFLPLLEFCELCIQRSCCELFASGLSESGENLIYCDSARYVCVESRNSQYVWIIHSYWNVIHVFRVGKAYTIFCEKNNPNSLSVVNRIGLTNEINLWTPSCFSKRTCVWNNYLVPIAYDGALFSWIAYFMNLLCDVCSWCKPFYNCVSISDTVRTSSLSFMNKYECSSLLFQSVVGVPLLKALLINHLCNLMNTKPIPEQNRIRDPNELLCLDLFLKDSPGSKTFPRIDSKQTTFLKGPIEILELVFDDFFSFLVVEISGGLVLFWIFHQLSDDIAEATFSMLSVIYINHINTKINYTMYMFGQFTRPIRNKELYYSISRIEQFMLFFKKLYRSDVEISYWQDIVYVTKLGGFYCSYWKALQDLRIKHPRARINVNGCHHIPSGSRNSGRNLNQCLMILSIVSCETEYIPILSSIKQKKEV